MLKLSKEELKKKIGEKITDDDLATEILEDIEDSFDTTDNTEYKTKITELETQLKDVKTKYKERFLQGTSGEDKNKKDDEEPDVKPEPRKFENLFDENGGIK